MSSFAVAAVVQPDLKTVRHPFLVVFVNRADAAKQRRDHRLWTYLCSLINEIFSRARRFQRLPSQFDYLQTGNADPLHSGW